MVNFMLCVFHNLKTPICQSPYKHPKACSPIPALRVPRNLMITLIKQVTKKWCPNSRSWDDFQPDQTALQGFALWFLLFLFPSKAGRAGRAEQEQTFRTRSSRWEISQTSQMKRMLWAPNGGSQWEGCCVPVPRDRLLPCHHSLLTVGSYSFHEQINESWKGKRN